MSVNSDGYKTHVGLLKRARNGEDDEAWNELAELYTPLIRKWLTGHVPLHDIDDVCQEVLTKVHQELPQFHHNGRVGAFRKWLRQVTAHRLRTFSRRGQRDPRAWGGDDCDRLAAELVDDNSDLSRAWDAEHDDHVLRFLLGRVESDSVGYQAFRRISLLGESPAEVAESLGMTVNAARLAKFRVLARLRQLGQELIDI